MARIGNERVIGQRYDEIRLPQAAQHRWRWRLGREWCFQRILWRHFRVRFVIMAAVLALGGWAFYGLDDPNRNRTFIDAVYFVWGLILGGTPDVHPESIFLRVLLFVLPVVGLTVILEGIVDFALVLRDRRRFERPWCMAMAASFSNHIILVGFGKLGYRTFRLLRQMGESVVVIERNERNEFLDDIRRDGSPLIIGDARREALLSDANIERAKSIVLATSDDLANLEIALDARRLVPGIRVVLRLFDQSLADKIREGFDIRLAVSQSALSAPTFAMAAIEASIVGSFVVEGRLVVMQRWPVLAGGPLCDKTVGEVITRLGCGVVEHVSKDDVSTLFPRPDMALRDGDRVVLQGPFEKLRELPPVAVSAAPVLTGR